MYSTKEVKFLFFVFDYKNIMTPLKKKTGNYVRKINQSTVTAQGPQLEQMLG